MNPEERKPSHHFVTLGSVKKPWDGLDYLKMNTLREAQYDLQSSPSSDGGASNIGVLCKP